MTSEDSAAPTTPLENAAGSGNKTETGDSLSSQRVFKKSSPNNKLTLYLSSRDLVVSAGRIDRLQGVLLVDPEFVEDRKVYGQVTLTFRYGREDEEVMGLKFCNEAIMCLAQLYPPHPAAQPPERNSPLQDALLRRLGANAYPFSMEITPLAPPSVQLVPAKEYNGAPIGTSYDVRAYIANQADEKFHRKTTVRMGIRVVQRAFAPPSPHLYNPSIFARGRPQDAPGKKTLFGCKSAPLEAKFLRAARQECKTRSMEAGLERQQHQTPKEGQVQLAADIIIQHGAPSRICELNHNAGVEEAVLENCVLQLEKKEMEEAPIKRVQTTHKDNKDTTQRVSFDTKLNGPEIHLEILNEAVEQLTNNDLSEPKENGFGENGAGDETRKEFDELLQADDPQTDSDNEKIIHEQFRSLCGGKRASLAAYLAGVPAPCAAIEKPFLLSEGKVHLLASLDKAIYSHGEEVHVFVQIKNNSNKTVRRIKVFVVQHVDVCMFSNGKFKNVVAMITSKDQCPIASQTTYERTFALLPVKSSTKNWIALEDSYTKQGTSLASTVTCSTHNSPDERNVFAIYVSYYVKVKLLVSVMGGEVALKLPFTLMHTCSDYDHCELVNRVQAAPPPARAPDET